MGLIDKLNTPNPSEKALRVWVPCEKIIPKLEPTAGVTLYKDFKLHPAGNRAEGYSDYVFIGCGDTVGAGGPLDQSWVPYHFGKNKDDTAKYTPYDTELHSKEFPWPNVMERWRAEPDPTKAIEGRSPDGTQIFEMKWNALFRLKPYVDAKTQFERLLYLSPTKFELKKPVVLQPVSFGWDLPGDGMEPARMLIGSRIHKPTRVIGPAILSQTTYEPTLPSGWTRHLHDTDQQRLESGLWHMWEDYALPPSGSATIHDR